uniref:Botryococcene C-methyltransferase n=1 Tax=Botryococcus braunii TaxID=38881 RepID=BOMT_BOTBR|nr:RecName: Full=Botryococcene C-methyltransferase; AltName: Full=Triterpene methyltransferase 3 [Botryococcus braunii]AEY68258.1 triterpene methyltransferase 3 [Botryococcus braunii]|eukprot:jgi/Botrbrau1/8198/Bobra.357_2s0038.1
MALDLLSSYAPGLVESLLTWKGAAGLAAAVALGYIIISNLPGRQVAKPSLLQVRTGGVAFEKVAEVVADYSDSYGQTEKGELIVKDNNKIVSLANTFYDLITDGYEWGWGSGFHFSHRLPGMSFNASQLLHESRMASFLRLKPGMQVLDVGCGVGNPGRTVAACSGAVVTGITINAYQIKRAELHTKRAGLVGYFKPVQGNFCAMPFQDKSFDAAFAMDSTCHAPKLEDVYSEVFRVLKPGAYFATYEWVSTKNYDSNNPEHVKCMNSIILGNGLPNIRSWKQAEEAGKNVGFNLLTSLDMATNSPIGKPWYSVPERMVNWGLFRFHKACIRTASTLHLLPPESWKFFYILAEMAENLVKGGQWDIFTPMHLLIFQKPE